MGSLGANVSANRNPRALFSKKSIIQAKEFKKKNPNRASSLFHPSRWSSPCAKEHFKRDVDGHWTGVVWLAKEPEVQQQEIHKTHRPGYWLRPLVSGQGRNLVKNLKTWTSMDHQPQEQSRLQWMKISHHSSVSRSCCRRVERMMEQGTGRMCHKVLHFKDCKYTTFIYGNDSR